MILTLIEVACPFNWPSRKCTAWGTAIPTDHGCKLRPEHRGQHVCACGARYREARQR